LRWADIEKATQPIVLMKDGKPVAVVIKYSDYQPQAERRNRAWQEIDTLLAKVHKRTAQTAVEDIEADITAAGLEVREQRNARRSS
jgi:PHD/YefM family antitoxin component YafN of YafNO toxin-antitoxin module